MNKATEETIAKLQEKTIREIVEIIYPWIELPSKPMPIKLKNTTVGTHQIDVSVEEGVVVIELKMRVAHPDPKTLIIPRDEEVMINIPSIEEESPIADEIASSLGFGTEHTR